jgi:hypothetical protein
MSIGSSFKPMSDRELGSDIDEVKDMFRTQVPRNQAINLAKYLALLFLTKANWLWSMDCLLLDCCRFVALKFGGAVGREDVANLSYELSINELKFDLKSNVVPLGKIKVGTYYHRALLFKVSIDLTAIAHLTQINQFF